MAWFELYIASFFLCVRQFICVQVPVVECAHNYYVMPRQLASSNFIPSGRP